MKFTRVPEDLFSNIQMNAGILATSFDPDTLEVGDLLGATTGGSNFSAVPTYSDKGEDIDNCPKNMMELKNLDEWEITLGTTFVSVNADTVKKIIGAADIDAYGKVTPRNDLKAEDFEDLWWIGDYSDKNTGNTAGYIAIHMMNTLSTGGFAIQTGDKSKGTFAVTFTAHYSMAEQDKVPFEVYVKQGE